MVKTPAVSVCKATPADHHSMLAAAENPLDKFIHSLHVLRGLQNASFRELAQSRAAFTHLYLFLTDDNDAVPQRSVPSQDARINSLYDSLNAVPLFTSFCGTALQHLQQQQQGVLQAPASDLAFISMICESVFAATHLPSSTQCSGTESTAAATQCCAR